VSGRLQALVAQLAAEAEQHQAAVKAAGVPVASYLSAHQRVTPREASRLVQAGLEVARHPAVERAALAGVVQPAQAAAIAGALDRLPEDLPDDRRETAAHVMIGRAETTDATGLKALSGQLVEMICPDRAGDLEETRAVRQRERAWRDRYLAFTDDGQGSLRFSGSLPVVEGLEVQRIIDAYADRDRRDRDKAPGGEPVTFGQRRADGLVAWTRDSQRRSAAPAHGGDRPRLTVTIGYRDLLDDLLAVRLGGSGELVDPGTARRLACLAGVLPVVLGGASEPVDVGREYRFVTPGLRRAVEWRDQGCVFPNCHVPAERCDCHHVVPWWRGGPTSLDNLVLLCPHHHGLLEPSHDPTADRWEVRLNDQGLPEVWPPRRGVIRREPMLHQRFRQRRDPLGPAGPLDGRPTNPPSPPVPEPEPGLGASQPALLAA
jgi:hypothetical protein